MLTNRERDVWSSLTCGIMHITNSLSPSNLNQSILEICQLVPNHIYVLDLRVIATESSTTTIRQYHNVQIKEWGVTDSQRHLVILLDVIYARLTAERLTTERLLSFDHIFLLTICSILPLKDISC